MALIDMWKANRDGIREKSLHQLLAFAGEGKLSDGNTCCKEFRELLGELSLDVLRRHASEALNGDADAPGLALQDIVNTLGARLGYQVQNGLYRGRHGEPGHDGLWRDPSSAHSIVIEVKSTSAYRIKLEPIAKYQEALADAGKIKPRESSALIVVGQKDEDTSDLEAQIRGSRHHAGDVRVISLDGLFKMVALKNDTDDPASAQLLRGVLVPKEYTKLDELLEIVSFVAQDLVPDQPAGTDLEEVKEKGGGREGAYVSKLDKDALRHQMEELVQKKIGQGLKGISRSLYESLDGKIAIAYAPSQAYVHKSYTGYWFALHDHQVDFLKKYASGFVAYYCAGAGILLLPWDEVSKWVKYLGESSHNGRHWWHVVLKNVKGSWEMRLKAGSPGNPVNIGKWFASNGP